MTLKHETARWAEPVALTARMQPPPAPTPWPRRALTLGLILIIPACFWTEYAEIVAQATDASGFSLLVPAVSMLCLISLINRFLDRRAPRYALARSDILLVYVMLTVSVAVSGVGMMQIIPPMLGNATYYATAENHWHALFAPYLHSWLFPDPRVLHGFYTGSSSPFTYPVLRGWIWPIASWSLCFCALAAVMLCTSALLREHWIREERLSFPIATLPLEVTSSEGKALTNPLLWVGAALPLCLQSLAALHSFYPSVPFIPLKPSDPRLDLSPLFSQAPWTGVGYLALSFHPLVIAITYFVTLDFGFSLWFFYLAAKLTGVVVTAFGFGGGASGFFMNTSTVAHFGAQSFGAFLALAVYALFSARRGIMTAVRLAFRPTEANRGARSVKESRILLGVLTLSLAFLMIFSIAIGMAWYVPLLFFALYFAFMVTLTRIRAEAGVPWSYGPDMSIHDFATASGASAVLGSGSLAGLAMFQSFDIVLRNAQMPYQMEGLKIAESSGVEARQVMWCMAAGIVAAVLCSWVALLWIYYHFGAASARVQDWRTNVASLPWHTLQSWLTTKARADPTRMWAVTIGALVTILLIALRLRYVGWPLHPLGYAVSGTFTMPWIWSAVLIGWLIKLLVVRYGGLRAYRRLMPIFMGIIIGECLTAAAWSGIGAVTGVQVYRTFPY